MKIVDAKCKNCGAELSLDSEKTMLFCPYCGTKLLIIDGDEVKAEKVRADAYREVELAREETKRERDRQEHEREKEMIEKGDNVRIELERLKSERQSERERHRSERQSERERHRQERRMQKLRNKQEKKDSLAEDYTGDYINIIARNLFTIISMIIVIFGIYKSRGAASSGKLIITLSGIMLITSAILSGREDEQLAASAGATIASLVFLGIAKASAVLEKIGYDYNDMVNIMVFLGIVSLIISLINVIRKAKEAYLYGIEKGLVSGSLRIILIALLMFFVAMAIVLGPNAINGTREKKRIEAANVLSAGEYDRAIDLYKSIGEKAGANYALGCKLEEQGDFDGAIEAFGNAGSFDGASEELERIQAYMKAELLLENGDRDGAIQAFSEAASCYDALQRKGELCYIKAEELRKANDKRGAVIAYEQAIPYADADDKAKKLYNELGEDALAIGDYDEAIYYFEESENVDSIAKAKYEQSLKLLSEGDYEGAYRILVTQQDREEVRMLIVNTPELSNLRRQEYLSVGNTVSMGNIDWIVLDVDGKRSLLITKKALKGVPFNSDRSEVTWENATIRAWLNERFYNDTFSEDEKKSIVITKVYNGLDQGYSEYAEVKGRTTKDKLFFLSYKEAWNYFFDDDSRQTGFSAWWLRSPGEDKDQAAVVNSIGRVGSNYVDNTLNHIRPAMWVDTNKL